MCGGTAPLTKEVTIGQRSLRAGQLWCMPGWPSAPRPHTGPCHGQGESRFLPIGQKVAGPKDPCCPGLSAVPRSEPRLPSLSHGGQLCHLFGFLQGVVVECVLVQGLQEGHVQVPAGLHELLRQVQLLLKHVIEGEHGWAVSCQGCPQHRVTERPLGPCPPIPTPDPSSCQRQLLWPQVFCRPHSFCCVSILSRSNAT